MSVRYELYLRVREGDDPLTRDRVLEALRDCQFEPAEGMLGQIDLGHGELRARDYATSDWDRSDGVAQAEDRAAGVPDEIQGIQFSFPLGLPDVEGEIAIQRILDVTDYLLTDAYDPQLGSLVTRSDHDRIAQSWHQSHEFHFGVAGTLGLGPGAPSTPIRTEPAIPARYKMMALVAGVLLLLIMMVRSCVKQWLDDAMYPSAPVERPVDEPPAE